MATYGSKTKRKPRKKGFYRRRARKVCEFCVDKDLVIDYKNVDMMRKYITDRGKIKPRRMTGACAKHQRKITLHVKRAREMALIPYTKD
ncbi:MAG TPA: 30S ribosomal protein S18 [bacterium]|nr:30S ribosomal protein S18 [bacterium]